MKDLHALTPTVTGPRSVATPSSVPLTAAIGLRRVTGGSRHEAEALFWTKAEADRELAKRDQATLVRVWRPRFDPESWVTAS